MHVYTITIYSSHQVDSIVTFVNAFEAYSILDVIPRKEMALNYFKKESPELFIINADRNEYLQLRGVIAEVNSKLLLISSGLSPAELFEAFRIGVLGYIDDKVNPVNLFEALNQVKMGELYIPQEPLKLLIDSFKLADNTVLTKREREVLELLRTGKTYAMIAHDLYLSGNTIRTYMQNIYQKLNANSKAEAIQIATKSRII